MNSKIREKTKYFLFRSKVHLTASLFLAVLLLLILFKFKTNWWNWAEPFITLLTLGVAIAVWYKQTIEAWEDDLPKRLTVHFWFQGREVMRCEQAALSSEADIRNLGQQVGLQISGAESLKFVVADVKQIKTGVKILKIAEAGESGQYIKEYEVSFNLTELPAKLEQSQCVIWCYPFIQENGEKYFKIEKNEN